jgi:hypothetical protein
MEITEKIDAEETPQSRQRKRIAKEASARKKKAEAKLEEWYEISAERKVVKCVRSGTGNVHRVYQCQDDAKNRDWVEGLKKKGLVRLK